MTKKQAVQHWQLSALRNIETAESLVKLKHHDWALFIGQLALEKSLKGLVIVKTGKLPPRIHDLQKLAELAGIKLTNKQINDFTEISRFHIQARYDDIKYELYKIATVEYTQKWFNKIRNYYLWLQKLY